MKKLWDKLAFRSKVVVDKCLAYYARGARADMLAHLFERRLVKLYSTIMALRVSLRNAECEIAVLEGRLDRKYEWQERLNESRDEIERLKRVVSELSSCHE